MFVKWGSLAAAFWASEGKQQVSIINSLLCLRLTRENHKQQLPCQLFSSTAVSCSDCCAVSAGFFGFFCHLFVGEPLNTSQSCV